MSKLLRVQNGVDLLADPSIEAFLDAREHWAYRCSLKKNAILRELRERSHPVLERFLAATERPEGQRHIDEYLRLIYRSKVRTFSGASQWLKAHCPEGYALLDAPDAKTFEELRLAYRRAALVHHPDRGGKHEDMVALNEAFALLHSSLSLTDDMMSDRDSFDQVLNCHSFRYRVARGLLGDAIDDWNIDVACKYLSLVTREFGADIHSLSRFEVRDFLLLVCRLAVRLAVAGRRDSYGEVAATIGSFRAAAAEQWRFVEPELHDSFAVLSGAKRSPIKILHDRQIPYLEALGLLKKSSVASHRARKTEKAAQDSATQSRLSAFVSAIGFILDLPSDAAARRRSLEDPTAATSHDLVPEGDYYETDTRNMNADQAREYFTAFGADPDLTRVRKYAYVRTTSLLVSAAFHPEICWGDREIEELSLMREIASGTAPSYAGLAIELLQKYVAETREERVLRAQAFSRIKSGKFTYAGCMQDRPLDRPLSGDGLRILARPIADLRELLETGILPVTDSIWPASRGRPLKGG